MNDYESHLSSYDHTHKQRLKEMKEMQRQVKGGVEGEKKGEKGPLISVKLGGKKEEGGKSGGWKKVGGGFKDAFAPVGGEAEKGVEMEEGVEEKSVEVDSDITDEEDYYDPRRPTGCMPGCPRVVGG